MLKHSIVSCLVVAGAVTTAMAFTALAKEAKTDTARPKAVECQISVKENSEGVKGPMPDFKINDEGQRYFMTEDGIMITFTESSEADGDHRSEVVVSTPKK